MSEGEPSKAAGDAGAGAAGAAAAAAAPAPGKRFSLRGWLKSVGNAAVEVASAASAAARNATAAAQSSMSGSGGGSGSGSRRNSRPGSPANGAISDPGPVMVVAHAGRPPRTPAKPAPAKRSTSAASAGSSGGGGGGSFSPFSSPSSSSSLRSLGLGGLGKRKLGPKLRAILQADMLVHQKDRSTAAGLALIESYEATWAAMHDDTLTAVAVANRAHDALAANQRHTNQLHSRLDGLHNELVQLPDLLKTMADSASALDSLRASLAEVEGALDDYEDVRMRQRVEAAKAAEQQRFDAHFARKRADVNQKISTMRQQHHQRLLEASREAALQTEEKQRAYEDLFKRQMEYFKEHGKADFIPFDRDKGESPAGGAGAGAGAIDMGQIPTLGPADLDPMGQDELKDFLSEGVGADTTAAEPADAGAGAGSAPAGVPAHEQPVAAGGPEAEPSTSADETDGDGDASQNISIISTVEEPEVEAVPESDGESSESAAEAGK